MAKLRRNHQKSKGGASSAVRIAIFFAVLCGMIYFLWASTQQKDGLSVPAPVIAPASKAKTLSGSMLPESSTGAVIKHTYYTLSYDEEHEQAEWVAYKLTKASIKAPNVKRGKWFHPDKDVKTGSAVHSDYRGSGYSRGHLAPAGDMAFNKQAMKESFFMSNMSPQKRAMNQGIWNELEMSVRNWAWDNKEVYVVTGPVLTPGHIVKKIGHNKVSVPDLYYKVILDYSGKDMKGIAFLIPNESSDEPLKRYAVTIDEVEAVTGIDFFSDYLDEMTETKIESSLDVNAWRWDDKLYQQRVKSWNNQ